MAYSGYFPQYQSQPMYPVPQQMNQPQIQQQIPVQQVPQQMQNGGFMSVRTEQEARNYPVAPGSVMTFKIENQPIVCEKAQGFSQLEGPVFNKYRLVKENEKQEAVSEPVTTTDDLRNDVEHLKEEIRALKERLYSRSKSLNKPIENKGGYKNE